MVRRITALWLMTVCAFVCAISPAGACLTTDHGQNATVELCPDAGLGRSQVAPVPQFGLIVFCEDVSEWGMPVNPADEFPAGTTEVRALFSHRNMSLGQSWG